MDGKHTDPKRPDSPSPGARAAGFRRRDLLKLPVALGVGGLALPGLADAHHKPEHDKPKPDKSDGITVAPLYFPRERARSEIDLRGKLAVITGASRGNGRAVGEALAAKGVDVIGTSRNPATVVLAPSLIRRRRAVAREGDRPIVADGRSSQDSPRIATRVPCSGPVSSRDAHPSTRGSTSFSTRSSCPNWSQPVMRRVTSLN